jgi:hypothetical protein
MAVKEEEEDLPSTTVHMVLEVPLASDLMRAYPNPPSTCEAAHQAASYRTASEADQIEEIQVVVVDDEVGGDRSSACYFHHDLH